MVFLNTNQQRSPNSGDLKLGAFFVFSISSARNPTTSALSTAQGIHGIHDYLSRRTFFMLHLHIHSAQYSFGSSRMVNLVERFWLKVGRLSFSDLIPPRSRITRGMNGTPLANGISTSQYWLWVHFFAGDMDTRSTRSRLLTKLPLRLLSQIVNPSPLH